MTRRTGLFAVAAAIVAVASLQAQVTFDRILHADREPHNWLSYSGTPFNQRYSPLTQINTANAKNLELQWVWQARSLEKFEATALVVDGVLYTVQAPNDVVAMDAETGRPFWTTTYAPAPEARTCCGRVNRGLAILGDTLYMGTIDAHLLALDAKTGEILWNTHGRERERALLDHDVAAHREGQGDHRHRGRRRVRSAGRSRPSTRRRARSCGASTRFPGQASRATTRGRATRG